MDYVVMKWLHILSSTFLVGTGIGSAWYLLLAKIGKDLHALAQTGKYVQVTAWLFTAITAIVQPATGFYMLHLAGYPLHTRWITWTVALYIIAAGCWLPALWLQTRLRAISLDAAGTGVELPPLYWKYFRVWVALGVPAFGAFAYIFWLMVAKPV
jgi:uncharacterized membrane protein